MDVLTSCVHGIVNNSITKKYIILRAGEIIKLVMADRIGCCESATLTLFAVNLGAVKTYH